MSLRESLISNALEWQTRFGVAPAITSSISEYDAAILVGCSETEYSECMTNRTAVSKGYDFSHDDIRYQVKANRPSGKSGSKVTLVSKVKNYDWDVLIWILYDTQFVMQEAWSFSVSGYQQLFSDQSRLSPEDMRKGDCLYSQIPLLDDEALNENPLELSKNQRCDLVNQFLLDIKSERFIYYEKSRFYLDRNAVEQLNFASPYLIIQISPTESSDRAGYKSGYVLLTLKELHSLFKHHLKTKSWETAGCYHVPKPTKAIQSVFVCEPDILKYPSPAQKIRNLAARDKAMKHARETIARLKNLTT